MKLGLENKKEVAALGLLVAVAGIMLYRNVFSGAEPSARPAAAAVGTAANAAPLPPAPYTPDSAASAPRRPRTGNESEGFHPVLRPKRAEDRIDPMKVDPTLHLEVLARLQSAGSESNGRNVFLFGAPPPPPAPKVAALKMPEPVVIPQPMQTAANRVSGPPPPPPIPLKFYGMKKMRATGVKNVFFKQGESIFIVGEGDLVMNRYRVKSIGVNSVVIEDTQLKREQTMPLVEDADGPG